MIRTIPVPTTVSRIGCACGGGAMQGTHTNRIAGNRNSALRAQLGDITCDASGNCYDVTSTITYGQPIDPGIAPAPLPVISPVSTALQIAATSTPAPISAPGGISNTWLYIGGALLMVLLLEGSSRR